MSMMDRTFTGWRLWAALRLCLGLVCGAFLPTTSQAQVCYVNGSFLLNFGAVTSAGKAASAQLSYTCAPDYSGTDQTFYYQLCVYVGRGDWSAGQPTRRMTNYNGAYLNYDLFSDPAHTQLIGEPGNTPVYQMSLVVPPGGGPQGGQAVIHGWVYPGQTVPAVSGYQEQGQQGLIRYRVGTTSFPRSPDCSTDGVTGGSFGFGSSGVLAAFENSCTVTSTDVDFGAVMAPSQPLHATASVRINCAPGSAWKVGLDHGQHYDGTMRQMAGAGEFIKYQLYRDVSRTQVWENVDGSMAVGSTDSAGHASLTIYAEVPPQPQVEAGFYSDTVVITLYH